MRIRMTRLQSSTGRLHRNGMSLVEVMTVLAIMGIIMAVAGPLLSDFLNRTRINSVSTLLGSSLQRAKGEAVSKNRPVLVCPANAAYTDCQDTSDWAVRGWIVCYDFDSDGRCDCQDFDGNGICDDISLTTASAAPNLMTLPNPIRIERPDPAVAGITAVSTLMPSTPLNQKIRFSGIGSATAIDFSALPLVLANSAQINVLGTWTGAVAMPVTVQGTGAIRTTRAP